MKIAIPFVASLVMLFPTSKPHRDPPRIRRSPTPLKTGSMSHLAERWPKFFQPLTSSRWECLRASRAWPDNRDGHDALRHAAEERAQVESGRFAFLTLVLRLRDGAGLVEAALGRARPSVRRRQLLPHTGVA